MLPKINRIRKKKDFETIFKRAQRASQSFKSNLFIFKMMKNDLGLNRFGFVVSQKVSKKATVRNKVRRRLTEAIKAETENMKSGTDLVIIALSGIEKKDFSEIREAVNSALIKTKLIGKD
jgi:ribonuclease P protein component